MLCQLNSWLTSYPDIFHLLILWIILRLLRTNLLKNVFILKQATLRYKELDIVIDRENHQLPVDCIKNTALHIDDQVTSISSIDHIIQCVSARIFYLKVFSRDQEAHQ